MLVIRLYAIYTYIYIYIYTLLSILVIYIHMTSIKSRDISHDSDRSSC